MKGKYAFVEYERVDDAQAAIKELNGFTIRGHKIAVEATSKFTLFILKFLLYMY